MTAGPGAAPAGSGAGRSSGVVLGIDLGTTNCRCVLTGLDGSSLAAASSEVAVETPSPTAAEVQPERWWDATVAVVRRALRRADIDAAQVVGIGLSGLMHAPVLVADDGSVLAPSQLWLDQRCAPQAAALADELSGLSPMPDLRTSVSAPKLRWLSDHAPEVVRSARAVLLPKDFLRFRLTGEVVTDVADAIGTGLYDEAGGSWREPVVAAVGLRLSQLPPVLRADQLGGRLQPVAAEILGLPEGVPVAIGGPDTLSARAGIGPLERGTLLVYLGTAAWLAFVEGRDARGVVRARDAGAASATGAALRWSRDLLGGGLDYEAIDHLVEASEPGSRGVMFLPHLMGERGPEVAPGARGSWYGLTLAHERSDLLRAVMEGAAFQLRAIVEASGLSHRAMGARKAFRVFGGICRSEVWLQIFADVLGAALEVPREPEVSARGAAWFGARVSGRCLGVCEQWENPVQSVVEPNPDVVEAYDRFYRRYRSLDLLVLDALAHLEADVSPR